MDTITREQASNAHMSPMLVQPQLGGRELGHLLQVFPPSWHHLSLILAPSPYVGGSHPFTDTPGSTLQAAITLAGVSSAVHTAKPKPKRHKNADGSVTIDHPGSASRSALSLLHDAASVAHRTAQLDTSALPDYPQLLPVMAQPGGGNLCATRYQDPEGRWWCLTVSVGKGLVPRLPAVPTLPSGPNVQVG